MSGKRKEALLEILSSKTEGNAFVHKLQLIFLHYEKAMPFDKKKKQKMPSVIKGIAFDHEPILPLNIVTENETETRETESRTCIHVS